VTGHEQQGAHGIRDTAEGSDSGEISGEASLDGRIECTDDDWSECAL
jgi:hypothetical protein